MLKRFKNLSTLLIVSVMAFAVMGAYVYALKSNLENLKADNAMLLSNNGKIQSANELNNLVVIELERELKQQNDILNKQRAEIADIRIEKEKNKRQFKLALEKADEKSKLWANEFVPDDVIRLLNTSGPGGGANQSSQSISSSDIDTRLSSSRVYGRDKPRPSELYF